MKQCPCGSSLNFLNCCGPYLEGRTEAKTPEALMRSRYAAYTLANIPYIKKTMQGKALLGFNEAEAEKWSKAVVWLGLTVLKVHQTDEHTGFVEFKARFMEKDWIKVIHENSQFQCIEGVWLYVDGILQTVAPKKILRNSLCPCLSKKKFKNCHGSC